MNEWNDTRTLENQKCMVLYNVYIIKYHKITHDTEFFFRTLKLAVILISNKL